MRKIGWAAAGVAVTVTLVATMAVMAGGAQAREVPRPHLVVHPKRLKPGEQFEVQGSGFQPGEEVEIGECATRGEQFFPFACDENEVVATVGADGNFVASMHAEVCPVNEETGRARKSCWVGVFGGEPEDSFWLRPAVAVTVK